MRGISYLSLLLSNFPSLHSDASVDSLSSLCVPDSISTVCHRTDTLVLLLEFKICVTVLYLYLPMALYCFHSLDVSRSCKLLVRQSSLYSYGNIMIHEIHLHHVNCVELFTSLASIQLTWKWYAVLILYWKCKVVICKHFSTYYLSLCCLVFILELST